MLLRRRLNTVLLQWFLLLVVFAGSVWAMSLPGIRRDLVDDRLMLARTIAQALDRTLAGSIQSLARLSADLPDDTGAIESRIRPFRFESIFADAIYVVDGAGHVLASDPPGVTSIDRAWLGDREIVTSAVTKPGDPNRTVLAVVQPFRSGGEPRFLIAEMDVTGSRLQTFLKDLEPGASMHLEVIDDRGVVIAAADGRQILESLPDAATYRDRIRAHRSLVIEGSMVELAPGQSPETSLAAMAPLRFAAWGVVVRQRSAQALAGFISTARGLMLTGIVLAVTGVLLARTLSRSVVAPIHELSRQAEAMRSGDLTSVIAVAGDHEIKVLAHTLDDARARLASTLGELQAFNQRLEDQVAARTRVIVQQDEQRKVLLRRMMGATEDERRRLARELHDEIAQLLTVIQLSLHAMKVDSPEMSRANALLVRTQEEIHRIIHDLRPTMLDDLGLAAAMNSYADEHLRRQGLTVSLEIEPGLPAESEIETAIFRIYQELVTNILRHAKAENVSIELYRRENMLVLAVEDDGRGFDPDTKVNSAGLTGMRERAALVNGSIQIDSEPDLGTHVVAEIPLP